MDGVKLISVGHFKNRLLSAAELECKKRGYPLSDGQSEFNYLFMCIFDEIEPLYWTSEGESTFKYWMLHQDSDFNDDRNSYVSGPLFELDNECITTRDGTIFHSGKRSQSFRTI